MQRAVDIGMAVATVGLLIIIAFMTMGYAGEQRRFYDNRGNSVGTASTDSQGTTTFRDSRGNVIGKSTRK